MPIKKTILFSLIFTAFLLIGTTALAAGKTTIYFFWGEGCPHCEHEKPFLEEMQKKYPELEVKSFEVYSSKENQELFQKIAKAYNAEVRGVPMIFIGKDLIVGFGSKETTGKKIEELIQNCLSFDCPSPEKILEAGGIDFIETQKNQFCIHYFIKDDCLQCEKTSPYLEEISQKYEIDLKIYNVSESKEDEALYFKLQEFYNISFSGFPIVFLGDSYLIGEDRTKQNLEKVVLRCQSEGCPCPVEEIKQTLTQMPPISSFVPEEKEEIPIFLFGRKIDIPSTSSLLYLGIILGLADGVNPCMFSVLLFLLTYLLAIGSRKKAVKVGLVFSLGVFLIYFLFMLGMFNLIQLIGFIGKIKIIITVIALFAGLIMIKDFFFYGKWFSLEIPKSTKPAVEKLIKKGTIPSAIALALLSSLVELPCSAGIPLAYVTILAQRVSYVIPYLLFYNVFFVLPLILVIVLVALALARVDKIEKWRLFFRKYMRLVAGLILIFLGISLLKDWM